MQMTLTITADNPGEMVQVLQALQGAGVNAPVQIKAKETVAAPPAEPVAEAPARRGRPPKEKTEDAPKPEPAKFTVVPKAKVALPPDKEDITVLDIRTALTQFLQANSETAAAELLLKHGHTDRLSLLKPEYFAAVYRAAVTPAVTEAFNDDIKDVGA